MITENREYKEVEDFFYGRQRAYPDPLKFYLCSSIENRIIASDLITALESYNELWAECAFNWTRLVESNIKSSVLATTEIDAVRMADFIIVLLPGYFGTMTELGAALALNKPIFLIGNPIHMRDNRLNKNGTHIFLTHPLITNLTTDADLSIPYWQAETVQHITRHVNKKFGSL